MKQALSSALLLAAATLLAACGGGGGGSAAPAPAPPPAPAPAPAPIAQAEGAYTGTVSNGLQFQLLALENDQFYTLIGSTDTQGIFRVVSLIEGRGVSNNGSFTASNVREFLADGRVLTESVSAAYNAGVSISGTAQTPTGPVGFTGTAPVNTSYVYSTPARLSDISGAWSGGTLFGEGLSFTVGATGAISGASALGCTFTGTATPRTSGRNVFNASITFGPAPCALPNQTAQGIAITSVLANGRRELLIAGTNSARTVGTVVFAQR